VFFTIMKPISATEALKSANLLSANRYVSQPRNNSVTEKNKPVPRDRANSIKRKASAELNVQAQKKVNSENRPILLPQQLDGMDRKIKTLRGICSKLNEEAVKLKVDIGLENIIRGFCEFVDVSASLHEEFVKALPVSVEPQIIVDVAAEPEPETEPEPEPEQDNDVFSYSQVTAKKPKKVFAVKPAPATKKIADPKLEAFQEAVEQSERSTLIFNLNLGTKKTLNEKSILSLATNALSAAAATVEGNQGKPPSKEALSALDDVISVTENVTFFGKVTKPYENKRNPKDPRSRTFFTIPVQYEFKDRDVRVEAETILRETCKIDCTTPYPTILRHCIKKVIDHFRAEYPGDYIRVTVVADKLALKVSRRVKGDGWYVHDDLIRLPNQVLDIYARFVPEDLVMPRLPIRRRVSESEEMSTEPTVPALDPDPGPGSENSAAT
jgi:hypothetical protein